MELLFKTEIISIIFTSIIPHSLVMLLKKICFISSIRKYLPPCNDLLPTHLFIATPQSI